MNLKQKEDYDSRFNDISLISTNEEAKHYTSIHSQRQQTRILYMISFLTNMSHTTSVILSTYILSQYLVKIDDANKYDLTDLAFYPIFAGTCADFVWGYISDRLGRKKALNISLIGSALTMVLYGFSKSFNSLAFINALYGVFGSSEIFVSTMIGESNCKISRPKAFSYLPIINMIASVLGPMITTPFYISHVNDMVLNRDTSSIAGFPYLIPSLIASSISIAAYILSYYCLSETLDYKTNKLEEPIIVDKPTDQTMTFAESKKISIFRLNFSKNSLLVLILSFLLTLIYELYSKISRDWLTMDLSKGGLNLKQKYTYIVTPLSPIIMVTILYKYTYVYKNLGVLKQFISGFPTVGILLIFQIILTLIAKVASTFTVLSLYAILYSIESVIDTLRRISFELLLTESAEISGNLGTLNGISGTLSGVIYLMLYYAPKSHLSFLTDNNLPFPLNCGIMWLLVVLSLIGYWLSSKIEITAQKSQEIIQEHEI